MNEHYTKQLNLRIKKAQKLILYIGKTLKKAYLKSKNNIIVTLKKDGETVTNFDIEIDCFLQKNILKKFKDGWVSEESDKKVSDHNFHWILDPIDGTYNFSKEIPIFCISLALFYKNQPVAAFIYEPLQNILYSSYHNKSYYIKKKLKKMIQVSPIKLDQATISYGIHKSKLTHWQQKFLNKWINLEQKVLKTRKLGCTALEITYVALGKIDFYSIIGYRIWDIAAALLFAKNAGVKYFIDESNHIIVVYNPYIENDVKEFY